MHFRGESDRAAMPPGVEPTLQRLKEKDTSTLYHDGLEASTRSEIKSGRFNQKPQIIAQVLRM